MAVPDALMAFFANLFQFLQALLQKLYDLHKPPSYPPLKLKEANENGISRMGLPQKRPPHVQTRSASPCPVPNRIQTRYSHPESAPKEIVRESTRAKFKQLFCGATRGKTERLDTCLGEAGLITRRGTSSKAPAKVESILWLSKIISSTWPQIHEVSRNIIRDVVLPQVRAALPAPMRTSALQTFSLGNAVPVFDKIIVFHNDTERVILEMEVCWDSEELAIVLQAVSAIKLHISRIFFKGTLQLELSNFVNEVPVIGGVSLFFLETPEIQIEYNGLAALVQFPGISRLVNTAIKGVLEQLFVLPNRINVPLATEAQGADRKKMSGFRPMGVLILKPKSGHNLVGMDMKLFGGTATSDPYVLVDSAGMTHKSETIYKTCNPVWSDSLENTFKLVIYDLRQVVKIAVWDKDMNADDLIGEVEPLMLSSLIKRKTPRLPIFQEDKKKVTGHLQLSVDYLSLQPAAQGETKAKLLFVKFDEVFTEIRFPDGCKAKVTYGTDVKCSSPAFLMDVRYSHMHHRPIIEKLHQKKGMSIAEIAQLYDLDPFTISAILLKDSPNLSAEQVYDAIGGDYPNHKQTWELENFLYFYEENTPQELKIQLCDFGNKPFTDTKGISTDCLKMQTIQYSVKQQGKYKQISMEVTIEWCNLKS